MKNYKLRMYGLVPYNLSPIQQGIQFSHGIVEAFVNWDQNDRDLLNQWANDDKTVIILNGGTTNKSTLRLGTLNQHAHTLNTNGIKCSYFSEEDLGDQLTVVCFLVDERVWDKEKYPDFTPRNNLLFYPEQDPLYKDWMDSIGGEKNVFLRKFLSQFKLV